MRIRGWQRLDPLVLLLVGLLLGCGVLFADSLNAVRLGGFPLGFWFAQQGSILVFVVLVLIYALAMGKLDRDHHAELETLAAELAGEATDPR